MDVSEIEQKIAQNELNAAQVFTQMRQHIKPDDKLVRDALTMANARHIIKRSKSMLNAELYMYLFATGMTTAWARCLNLGLEPDGNETSYSDMMKHIENKVKS